MSNSTAFRPLNDNEKSCILAAAKKGRIKGNHPLVTDIDRATVSYEQMQGGFCVCVVYVSRVIEVVNADTLETVSAIFGLDGLVWRGASRRSYKDTRNPIKGEMLAFSRAVLYSRPVELV